MVLEGIGGVAGPELAEAATAAAKAAAAIKELCKKGDGKMAELAIPPPKVGLRMLSIEKANLLSLGRGKKG